MKPRNMTVRFINKDTGEEIEIALMRFVELEVSGVPVKDEPSEAPIPSNIGPVCQCGKEEHGFAKHAYWCDIKD